MKYLIENPSTMDLVNGLETGKFTSVTLVSKALDAIKNCPDQSIFITVTADRALAEAKASDERRAQGKILSQWDGIPISWKDLFDLEGTPTTAGSKAYDNIVEAEQDAAVVNMCKNAGLISLGKTNLSEFAYSGLGLNPSFGTPINPYSKSEAKAPGGSSAGSAVAVARGLSSLAVGTDTAGSVRVPASFCGIAGFKASQSRYANSGIYPLSSSLDSIGIFAQTAAELKQLDAVMRDKANVEEPALDIYLDQTTFIVPTNIVFDEIQSDIKSCFDELLDKLSAAGATIIKKAFPIFTEVTELFKQHGTLTVAEAYTVHETLLNSEQAKQMDQRVLTRMLTATQFKTTDYIKLQWARKRLEAETSKVLGDSFLLFPTTPITAPDIEALESSDDIFAATNLMALRNTMLGNFLAMPGVSLPIGFDGDELPVGALVSAPFEKDDRVLAVSIAVEEALK